MLEMKKFRPGHVALVRALSKLGFASRTNAEKLIRDGKVIVNGNKVTNPDHSVNPDTANILIDGLKIAKQVAKLWMIHKPKNTITSHSDEKGRKTVFDLLPDHFKKEHGHIIAVGRLDYTTTGLLLLTNETRIASFLTDPENKIEREYIATVRGEITDDKIEKCLQGFHDNIKENNKDELLKAKRLEVLKKSGRESTVRITLTEGKNREIRRMMLAIGHEVIKLKRVRFGPYLLGDLESGSIAELSIVSE